MFDQREIFSHLLLATQVGLVAFFVSGASFDEESFQYSEYVVFRDIMAMLLLGFGYLMTFLKTYGLGAVGFTLILTALAMQMNVLVEYGMKAAYYEEERQQWPMDVSMMTLIDAQFAAATLLITFGALIGRTSPMQMFVLLLVQSICYAFNKVVLVFGWMEAEDVGGSITIHMFGAYFGLAVSYALGPPDDQEAEQDKISDIFAFIGTTILWVFWPSFVGATETAHLEYEMRCVSNTVFALLASTTSTFYVSHLLTEYKFDPVHIANATLAGGVAIGTSARLITSPGGAIVVGAIAGGASVMGYHYVSPRLEANLGLYDTCGVGNLHGIPSLIGATASAIFIGMNSDAEFLAHDSGTQIGRQFGAIACTLVVSLVTGFGTGKLLVLLKQEDKTEYNDNIWWKAEYFEASRHARSLDPSVH